jgi:hypothetical protein
MALILGISACSSGPTTTTTIHNRPPGGPAEELTFRRLSTGAVRRDSHLITYKLQRRGAMATLEVVDAKVQHTTDELLPEAIHGTWKADAPKLYSGPTVDRGGGAFDLDLQDGKDILALACKPVKLKVAAATAVRARSPGAGECGDTGVWQPSPTVSVDVVACIERADDNDKDLRTALMFAPAPGVEFLFVNDDCVIQGGGFRRVADGGAIGKIRAPSRNP